MPAGEMLLQAVLLLVGVVLVVAVTAHDLFPVTEPPFYCYCYCF